MSQPTALPGTINGNMFDRFTVAHAGVGVAYGLVGMPFWLAAVLAVGWEFAERPLKNEFPEFFPHSSQDTIANATVDSIAVIGGWWLASQLRRR